MADDEEIVAVLFFKNFIQTGADPFIKMFYTFPTSRRLEGGQSIFPFLQFIREAHTNLFQSQPFPIPEINLTKVGPLVQRDIVVTGYYPGALDGSLKIARIDGLDGGKPQALSQSFSL